MRFYTLFTHYKGFIQARNAQRLVRKEHPIHGAASRVARGFQPRAVLAEMVLPIQDDSGHHLVYMGMAQSVMFTALKRSGFVVISLLSLQSCVLHGVRRHKDITYTPQGKPAYRLNVFSPRSRKKAWPVLVYIHGGNWDSGKKGLYSFFGSRFARKRVVSVVIDYPLGPVAKYDNMAYATAQAVNWTHANIASYGGDSARIFVSGHSAGGHLAALVGLDNRYFDSLRVANPIKGIVLIDAAGLDMYGYIQAGNREYVDIFSTNPAIQKLGTPLYHLHAGMPSFLILRGGKTYPSIIASNEKFVTALRPYQPDFRYILQPKRHHVPMITQFFYSFNKRYYDINRFMENPR